MRLLAAAVEHGDHQQQQHAQAEHVPDEVAALRRRFLLGLFAVRLGFLIFIHRFRQARSAATVNQS